MWLPSTGNFSAGMGGSSWVQASLNETIIRASWGAYRKLVDRAFKHCDSCAYGILWLDDFELTGEYYED
jgi:hypothetical protein